MQKQLFNELVKNLNQLVWVYRHLFDLVRQEKQILLTAELQELSNLNSAKEKMLKKISELEKVWMGTASELCTHLGLTGTTPRLSEIAEKYSGKEQEKLLRFRTVLNLLISRTSSINKQNDLLAQSALSHIAGAMQAITETLNKKSTYEKKGKRSDSPTETSGRLVRREV